MRFEINKSQIILIDINRGQPMAKWSTPRERQFARSLPNPNPDQTLPYPRMNCSSLFFLLHFTIWRCFLRSWNNLCRGRKGFDPPPSVILLLHIHQTCPTSPSIAAKFPFRYLNSLLTPPSHLLDHQPFFCLHRNRPLETISVSNLSNSLLPSTTNFQVFFLLRSPGDGP